MASIRPGSLHHVKPPEEYLRGTLLQITDGVTEHDVTHRFVSNEKENP